jgi:hypothetical protein
MLSFAVGCRVGLQSSLLFSVTSVPSVVMLLQFGARQEKERGAPSAEQRTPA